MAEGIGVPRGGGGIVGVHVEGGLRMVVVARGRRRWGTWEELILGGAVLRHGTQSWGAVASELRARTLFPYSFTPEVKKFNLFFDVFVIQIYIYTHTHVYMGLNFSICIYTRRETRTCFLFWTL